MMLADMGKPYPLYFTIQPGYGNNEMITLNKNLENWKLKDYLKHYVESGNENYIEYKRFMETFPWLTQAGAKSIFTFKSTQKYTGRVAHKSLSNKSDFQEGRMTIPKDLDIYYDVASRIESLSEFYKGYDRAQFVRTMVSLFEMDTFDFNRFYDKLSNTGGKRYALEDVTTVEQYRERINLIYNYKVLKENYVELRLAKK